MDELIAVQAQETQGQQPDRAQPLPDARLVLVTGHGELAGRCSLWWHTAPSLPGHRLGLIGHYSARDREASHRLLRHACEELRARGCSFAVGPMDGNTWRRYRFIIERGKEPVFFLEPDNPDDWPAHFVELGFTPLAQYFSAINHDLSQQDSRMPEVAKSLTARGIRIRQLDTQHLDDELRRIYVISQASFAKNFLYTPTSEAAFITQYRGILLAIRPELILIAEEDERPVGFIFAVPDLLQARRGKQIDTVILKTVAVLPERSSAGLGALLVARCQETARDLGYTRAIHALMHESNPSRNLGRHYTQPMRRYALFAKRLG